MGGGDVQNEQERSTEGSVDCWSRAYEVRRCGQKQLAPIQLRAFKAGLAIQAWLRVMGLNSREGGLEYLRTYPSFSKLTSQFRDDSRAKTEKCPSPKVAVAKQSGNSPRNFLACFTKIYFLVEPPHRTEDPSKEVVAASFRRRERRVVASSHFPDISPEFAERFLQAAPPRALSIFRQVLRCFTARRG